MAIETSHPTALSVLIAGRHRTVAQSLARVVDSFGATEVAGETTSNEDAIEIAGKVGPDVAIVDLDLSPTCSLVRGLHSISPETRIIVLADKNGDHGELIVRALESGAVGAIYKESAPEELVRALSRSSRDTPVVADEATGLLLGSYIDALTDKRKRDIATIEALAAAVEVRDLTTGSHLVRVGDLAIKCMEKIDSGLARNEEVSYGFTLHDIGKIGVPDAILNKPGPLSGDEWEVMQTHPRLGCKIVEPLGFSATATDVILSHHERWDGSGYPLGLKGEGIPLTARAFAVADMFDAMTSDRPYRAALPKETALSALSDEAGKSLDPDVAQVFIDLND